MTPAQADWLRKLRDEGPVQSPNCFAHIGCQLQGHSHRASFDRGVNRLPWWTHMITPAGLAALEAQEKETTP